MILSWCAKNVNPFIDVSASEEKLCDYYTWDNFVIYYWSDYLHNRQHQGFPAGAV